MVITMMKISVCQVAFEPGDVRIVIEIIIIMVIRVMMKMMNDDDYDDYPSTKYPEEMKPSLTES